MVGWRNGVPEGRRVHLSGDPVSPSITRLSPYVAAFVVGLLNALQSRMNGGLATEWGSPVMAGVWSFGTGLIALTVLVLVRPSLRLGVLEVGRALRALTPSHGCSS